MHPILFKIGPVTLYTYGFMMAMAFLTCYFILQGELKKRDEHPDFASNIVFWAAIGGILGAKILYLLENLPDFFADPIGMVFTRSGLVFHGGLIGGAATVIIYLKRSKKSIRIYADIIGPLLLVGQAIGRIGCFFAGCCHGKACDLPWAVTFPYASPPADFPVHPTQLYETILNLILFFILIKIIRPRMKRDGSTFGFYLIFAGIERFLIEFLRVNPIVLWGLSSAQFTSMGIALAGIVMLMFFTKPGEKKK